MKPFKNLLLPLALVIAGVAVGTLGGRWWALHGNDSGGPSGAVSGPSADGGREVLYWYDPMYPQQHFDQPGKSPFMDMALVPRYADEAVDQDDEGAAVKIDPAVTQNLGMRLTRVERISLTTRIDASGMIGFNERAVAVVQSRTAGFVDRVWPLAPGDVVAAGQPLAEFLVPDWAAAQHELLAVRAIGDTALMAAAHERLRLLGMPDDMLRAVEQSGVVKAHHTVRAPIGGVLESLDVRTGMTLSAGQTLARLKGLNPVWLEIAVPEALASQVAVGGQVQAQVASLPTEMIVGRVNAVLPVLDETTRSLRVRIELPNADGRLRPGQSAQVSLAGGSDEAALAVPTEAVIRTGKRALVMVAEFGGRYRPQPVTLGAELDDKTVIRAGLDEGQQVVASGQFLLDSEASLLGIGAGPPAAALPVERATPDGEQAP